MLLLPLPLPPAVQQLPLPAQLQPAVELAAAVAVPAAAAACGHSPGLPPIQQLTTKTAIRHLPYVVFRVWQLYPGITLVANTASMLSVV
jgi:hypothetical protein